MILQVDWSRWKPKPGDKIICIVDHGPDHAYKLGKIYTVKKFFNNEEYWFQSTVLTTLDERGSTENGWRIQFFRPATKAGEVLYTNKEKTDVNGTQTE